MPNHQKKQFDRQILREEIPVLRNCTYLNTAGIGPTPAKVHHKITELYGQILESGGASKPVLNQLTSESEHARSVLSVFLGAEKTELSFVRSVAEGINMVAHGLNWSAEDEVIISDQENPAGVLPFMNLSRRKGIKIKKLHLSNDATKVIRTLETLIGPKTRLVALSHVTHNHGFRLPAAEICAVAHRFEVPVLFDGAQALGQFPVDVKKLNCDFYAAAGYKWLLGPWGTGMLYINKNGPVTLDPLFVGVGSEKSFDFSAGSFALWNDARKFEYGGRHWPLYAAMGAAVEYVASFSLHRIAERVSELTVRLKDQLAGIREIVLVSPDSPELSSGIVTFTIPNFDAVHMVDWLYREKNIVAQWRHLSAPFANTKGIRISIGFFTGEDEIDFVVEAIRTYVKAR